MKLLRRRPKPTLSGRRLDYREKCWGKSIGWERDKRGVYRGHMWSPWGARVGDRINVGASEDLRLLTVDQARDPRDMFFFTADAYPASADEAASFGLRGDLL